MFSNERRYCKRVLLNPPIKIGMVNDSKHRGEILDASVQGLRVRMTQSRFHVGQEVDIACLPHQGQITEPAPFHCLVVWENAKNLEVGLKYFH